MEQTAAGLSTTHGIDGDVCASQMEIRIPGMELMKKRNRRGVKKAPISTYVTSKIMKGISTD